MRITVAETSTAIAAISAIAASLSARSSARGVALSHRPFVVGEDYEDWTEMLPEQGLAVIGVTLRNDGPGVAVGVRFRARAWTHDIDTGWSPQIRSLRSGEETQSSVPFSVPPGISDIELGLMQGDEAAPEPKLVLWYVETEFADLRGVVWTARCLNAFDPPSRPQRVRSWKIDLWRPKAGSTGSGEGFLTRLMWKAMLAMERAENRAIDRAGNLAARPHDDGK